MEVYLWIGAILAGVFYFKTKDSFLERLPRRKVAIVLLTVAVFWLPLLFICAILYMMYLFLEAFP